MSESGRILVATDVVDDAKLVRRLLSDEFGEIAVTTDATRAVADFEAMRPEVLVLAFDSVEKAEAWYLGLYRLSTTIQAVPHRTLILCGKDDVHRVFQLCKKSYFDDYVLFWPMSHDAPRLPMSVLLQLRLLRAADAGGLAARLAAQIRALEDVGPLLARQGTHGDEALDRARRGVAQVKQAVDAALSVLGVPAGAAADEARAVEAAVRERLQQLSGPLANGLQSIDGAIESIGDWLPAVRRDLEPHRESVSALRSMAAPLRPVVLLIDDDPFQHVLMSTFLQGEAIELVSAATGAEAMSVLQRSRPDAILVDLVLPDLDGVEVVRRIRATPLLAAVPVLMVTGNADKSVVVKSMRAGANGFLVKPVVRDAVVGRLKQLLGRTPALAGAVSG